MSRKSRSIASDEFTAQLARLRTKIDALPESHRPHLYELANTIQEQHVKQQRRQDARRRRHEAIDHAG